MPCCKTTTDCMGYGTLDAQGHTCSCTSVSPEPLARRHARDGLAHVSGLDAALV